MRVANDWWLTPARAAVHLPTRTAVVADLHLGYSEARRRGGDAIPVPSIEETLAPLAGVIRDHAVQQIVIAGDLLESGRVKDQLGTFVEWLQGQSIEHCALILGNHDRGLVQRPLEAITIYERFELGDWQVVHGDRELPQEAFVQGHLHPCLRWGRGQSVPCYLIGENRLILPAYSSDASGVDALRNAAWTDYDCYAITQEQVLCLGSLRTVSEKLRQGGNPARWITN